MLKNNTNTDSGSGNNKNKDGHQEYTFFQYHPSVNLPPEVDSTHAPQASDRPQTAPTSLTGTAAIEPAFTIDDDTEDAPVTYQNTALFAALHPVEVMGSTQPVVRQLTAASNPPAGMSSTTFNPAAPPFEMDIDLSNIDFEAAAAEIRQREIDSYKRWLFNTNPHLYPKGVTADELIELTRSIPQPYGTGLFAAEMTGIHGGHSRPPLAPAPSVGNLPTSALAKFPVDIEAIWGPLPQPVFVPTNKFALEPKRASEPKTNTGPEPEPEGVEQIPVEDEQTFSRSTARTRSWLEAIGEGVESPNPRPNGPAGNPFADPDATADARNSPPSMVAEPTDGESIMR